MHERIIPITITHLKRRTPDSGLGYSSAINFQATSESFPFSLSIYLSVYLSLSLSIPQVSQN